MKSSCSVSQIQKALEKNWVACIDLHYAVIAGHLVSAGHLSPAQHEQIKINNYNDKSRMDDLMTLLHKLGSVEAFQVLKTGAVRCGESELAQRLENDSLLATKHFSNIGLGNSVGATFPMRVIDAKDF